MTIETDLAWLAGIIDADGTITLEKDAQAPRVQVAMANLITVDKIDQLMLAITGKPTYRWKRESPGNHADSYYVRTTTFEAVDALLAALLPYLVTKRQVAEVVRRRIVLKDDSKAVKIAYSEAKALNKTGGSVHHSSPFPDDPVSRIVWLPHELLTGNAWNPNRVHKAEMQLLKTSLLSTLWLQPILVNPQGLIIDGFHRWSLVANDKEVSELTDGMVPCAVLELDKGESMLMTIRINRAKGTHVALSMSAIVHELLDDLGYSVEEVCKGIGASKAEVELLAQDGVFEAAKIADWAYSPAWYPKAVAGDVPDPELPDLAEEAQIG